MENIIVVLETIKKGAIIVGKVSIAAISIINFIGKARKGVGKN